MFLWWFAILMIYGFARGFDQIHGLFYLLLLPMLMQNWYDVRMTEGLRRILTGKDD